MDSLTLNPPLLLSTALVTGDHNASGVKFVAENKFQSPANVGQLKVISPLPATALLLTTTISGI